VTDSPRLNEWNIDQDGPAYAPPAWPTAEEISRTLSLASGRRAAAVAIGHGADGPSTAAARAFADAWLERDGTVLCTVRWPEKGASWLGPARRLTASEPDLYILGGAAAGLAQMIRRLLWSTGWSATKTVGFASASCATMHRLVGLHNLDGLAGATATGGTWEIANTVYTELSAGQRP
jgi:hypothetical protein